MHKSRHTCASHPVFAIDGVSLDEWLNKYVPDTLNLVPAQGWLIDDAEFDLAWRRIRRIEAGVSTVLPVLVCPDDVDLSCSVILVEQEGHDCEVIWRRFGRPEEALGDQCGATVRWIAPSPFCIFNKGQFETALADFEHLMKTEWK